MATFVVLLRGINVGGKNPVSMAALKSCLEDLGYTNVRTLLASGNVVVDSTKSATAIAAQIEKTLPQTFKLHDEVVRVLVLTSAQFKAVAANKPKGFGEQRGTYHSDAIFLIGIKVTEAMKVFSPKEGVDAVWPGKGVIYSQRVSAQRTKSRLGKIVGTPAYKLMTIRSWQTTEKLLGMLR